MIPTIRATTPVVRPSDRELDVAARALDESAVDDRNGSPLHPKFVTRTVDEVADPDAVFVADAGTPKGFTLYATRSVLSGRGDELIDLAGTNVTRSPP